MKPATKTDSSSSIGPAMIVAAVVCGPGSILTSSKVGAEFGYSAVWILVLACFLMIGMVALATRVGIAFEHSPCQELAGRLGRPVAVAIGLVMFAIIASFQSSNNFAIAAGLESFGLTADKKLAIGLVTILNVLVIAFLFLSRDLYRSIEWLMKILIGCMVVAFLINCVIARPSVASALAGLVPSRLNGDQWLLVALMGTTFSVAAAFYQSYLAREKNWTVADQRTGMIDSVVGIATLGMITLVIMLTSAAVFYEPASSDSPAPAALNSTADIARQLAPLFGKSAQYIFGIGILAGAVSSFLVNALIGGHILSDGFGLGERVESSWTKYFTTLALVVGMGIAIVSLMNETRPVKLIIFAQALTVIGVPALALALIYLGLVKRRMDRAAIPLWIIITSFAGLAATSVLAWRTVRNLIEKLSG